MKKKLGFILAIFMILSFASIFVGCDEQYGDAKTYYLTSGENDYFTQQVIDGTQTKKTMNDGNYDLTTLLASINAGDSIILERDITRSGSTPTTYTITKPITIKSVGTKKKIDGSITINLSNTEIKPVVIDNLEIIHTGIYTKTGETVTSDERRGILLKNGAATITNNYIHLNNEATTTLTTAPTGIQVSVNQANTIQNKLIYNINGNRIGVYNKSQTTASSDPTGILLVKDTNEALNITFANANNIYSGNTFDSFTNCYACIFNYQTVKYEYAVFKSQADAKAFAGDNYEYIADGLTVSQVGNVWKTVANA